VKQGRIIDTKYFADRITQFRNLERKYRCHMRIYGSVATGSATAASDIDILIVSASPPADMLASLQRELARLFAREVDLVERDSLIRILARRIRGELRTIDQLAAGEFAARRPKSPYLYLLIIQNEARDITREKHLGSEGKRRVGARARRIAHFFENRYRPLSSTVDASDFPVRQIRELTRISKRATQARTDTAQASAQVRRLARQIVKRLRLSSVHVEAHIAGVTVPGN